MLSDEMRRELDDKEQRNRSLGAGFEQRLKDLENADAEGKLTDRMIVALLTWGDADKTEEQFRKIEPWLDKIKDAEGRDASINYFWFIRARVALKENRLADATRFANKVPEVEHRAILSFEIADAQLKNVNDAPTVLQTLRDVGRLADQSDTSVEKARVLIALANAYLKVNPTFAMQELSDAVKAINQVENGDVMSTSVYRQIIVKDSSFYAGFSLPGANLEDTFKAISKDNFELSLSNAKALDDKYLRTIAVLAVAQNCVERAKKTPSRKKASLTRSN
jgi:hypothetical protein